ncbi:NYN domain-containing protein [Ferruginibacter profundus]
MATSKVAILIDGGFFLQRFKTLNQKNPRVGDMPAFIQDIMKKVAATNPGALPDMLLRSYYYDCRPNGDTKVDPNGNSVDFSQHGQFKAANAFHNDLRTFPQLALRLGELSFDGWKVDPSNKTNFIPDFKQKSVDIKIGLDIAWMSSKRTIDKLVLVAGDSDFVAPMKFARREGILVYLYPMAQPQIKLILKEHADFILP